VVWHHSVVWHSTQTDIDYVLPNSGNFGCDLFTDEDLYTAGTNAIQGCGGPSFDSPATMEITEQKGLCKIATQTASKQLINPADTRCFIAYQVVTPSTGRRLQGQLYSVLGAAMWNFDSTISPALVNPSRLEEIMVIGSSHLFHQLRPLRQQHLQERR
jgi:hypothetical protein